MAYTFAGAAMDLTKDQRSDEDRRKALMTLKRLAAGYTAKGKPVPKGIAREIAAYEAYFGERK